MAAFLAHRVGCIARKLRSYRSIGLRRFAVVLRP